MILLLKLVLFAILNNVLRISVDNNQNVNRVVLKVLKQYNIKR